MIVCFGLLGGLIADRLVWIWLGLHGFVLLGTLALEGLVCYK